MPHSVSSVRRISLVPAAVLALVIVLPVPGTCWAWRDLGGAALVLHAVISLVLGRAAVVMWGPEWQGPSRRVHTGEVHALLQGTPLVYDGATGSLKHLEPPVPVVWTRGRYRVGRFDLMRPADQQRLAALIQAGRAS